MKPFLIKTSLILATITLLTQAGCKKDSTVQQGSPEITMLTSFDTMYFADSLAFSAQVSDAQSIPLSTLKAYLYYGDELVSETTIRTKEFGEYSGKLYAPYYGHIPNGAATLKLVLQNIQQEQTEQQLPVRLERPDYPYLTLVVEDSTRYRMNRVGMYQYAAEENFPMKMKAYIEAPVFGTRGNTIAFGYANGQIVEGNKNWIEFSNLSDGIYPITFNSMTYAAGPFLSYKINGKDFGLIGEELYRADLTLQQNQTLDISGFADLANWWIDSDYIREEDGALKFNAINGNYRVVADVARKYFAVEALQGSEPAKLNTDGTGAIWVIGEGIGKPNLDNQVGWTTEKALCLAPVGNKKYRITVVAGEHIRPDNINFKFFHQKGWGGEFSGAQLKTTSDLIFVGNGSNGRDSGNLGIVAGKRLEGGSTYVLTVDVSAGNQAAVLTVEKR